MHTSAAAPITALIPPVRPIGSNPGIVPPWLQGGPVGPSHPVGDDTPRILGPDDVAAAVRTGFDPSPIDVDPGVPHILAPH